MGLVSGAGSYRCLSIQDLPGYIDDTSEREICLEVLVNLE